ncbi:hypothetical protein OG767_00200 [Micromonospora sp. NBC_01392]|uniref:hypothetical protein n=1 Tax=Micromonospora sp. NBC_01392 TaxID=2903588 RepID=UPI00324F5B63
MVDFEIGPNKNPLPDEERRTVVAAAKFGQVFTVHMITLRWDEERGWHDGWVKAFPAPFPAAVGVGLPPRAGDLRRDEGVPPERRHHRPLPAGTQRRPVRRLGRIAVGCRTATAKACICGR